MLYADADDENDYEEVVEEILDFLEEHKNDVFPDAVFPTNRGRMGLSSFALKAGLRGERQHAPGGSST